jgi:hypothetical protein
MSLLTMIRTGKPGRLVMVKNEFGPLAKEMELVIALTSRNEFVITVDLADALGCLHNLRARRAARTADEAKNVALKLVEQASLGITEGWIDEWVTS